MTFIDFAKTYENRILKVIQIFSRTLGTKIKQPDYRALISGKFCSDLHDEFDNGSEGNVFHIDPSPGYDATWKKEHKISIKIQLEVFERPWLKNPNKTTQPKDIVMKNGLGKTKTDADAIDMNFDYLFVIERGEKDSPIIRFAIADKQTVLQHIKWSGDQAKYRMQNNQWLFLSRTEKIQERDFISDYLLDEILSKGIHETYQKMTRQAKQKK